LKIKIYPVYHGGWILEIMLYGIIFSISNNMVIEFINDQEWGIDTASLAPIIERLQGAIDCYDGILNVVFVTDSYIRALNKSYRSKDEPTDVLSFSYRADSPDNDLIGEIYISVETAEKQAGENNHGLTDELKKLFTHGFLHIHGYDHERDEDYKIMAAMEDRILR
jgi:probable rRNA maturation factor